DGIAVVDPLERGERLLHLSEAVAHSDLERPDLLLEAGRRIAPARRYERGPDRGVAREWKLARGAEDPNLVIAAVLCSVHERDLSEVELLRGGLHQCVADACAVMEHRELIAAELSVGEDIDERVLVAGHHRLADAAPSRGPTS